MQLNFASELIRNATDRRATYLLYKARGDIFRLRKGKRACERPREAGCADTAHGRGDRTRTCGILVPNQALYQTELRLDNSVLCGQLLHYTKKTVPCQEPAPDFPQLAKKARKAHASGLMRFLLLLENVLDIVSYVLSSVLDIINNVLGSVLDVACEVLSLISDIASLVSHIVGEVLDC